MRFLAVFSDMDRRIFVNFCMNVKDLRANKMTSLHFFRKNRKFRFLTQKRLKIAQSEVLGIFLGIVSYDLSKFLQGVNGFYGLNTDESWLFMENLNFRFFTK